MKQTKNTLAALKEIEELAKLLSEQTPNERTLGLYNVARLARLEYEIEIDEREA